ncbi:MAG: NAD-dependent epimerase/dehydratase family protein, partial [Opitutales bacterium]|nr:NAD-dependent epimerase/dehydratase family protein [Opitutales bacterium]
PSTPYGVAKLAGDLHIEALIKRYQFPAVFTRAANVYGPHQQLYRIIPRTILYLLSGKKLTLHGGGKSKRGFVNIRDVAQATLSAAEKGKIGESYHISETDQLISIRSLVELICKIMNVSTDGFLELTDENFGQDDCFSLSSKKAEVELGWKSQISLENGIESVVAWIKDNWQFLQTQPWDYQHKI